MIFDLAGGFSTDISVAMGPRGGRGGGGGSARTRPGPMHAVTATAAPPPRRRAVLLPRAAAPARPARAAMRSMTRAARLRRSLRANSAAASPSASSLAPSGSPENPIDVESEVEVQTNSRGPYFAMQIPVHTVPFMDVEQAGTFGPSQFLEMLLLTHLSAAGPRGPPPTSKKTLRAMKSARVTAEMRTRQEK